MRQISGIVGDIADSIPDYGENEDEYNPLFDEIVEPIEKLEKWAKENGKKNVACEYDMGYAQAVMELNRIMGWQYGPDNKINFTRDIEADRT